jgi:hypothetical protein
MGLTGFQRFMQNPHLAKYYLGDTCGDKSAGAFGI